MALIAIPIIVIVLWLSAAGAASISAMTGKAHVSWLGEIFNIGTAPLQILVKAATRLAEHIASALEPAYHSASVHVAGWLAGVGQALGWNATHAHRNSSAAYNTATWANTKLRAEIEKNSLVKSKGQTTTIIRTSAPSIPARRIATKDNAVAFRKSFEAELPKALAHDYPKVKWDRRAWLKWLGVVPAVGSVTVPFPRVIPRPQAIPKAQKKVNDSTAKRLKRLEKILGITGLAGLITATFGGEITRFLRCSNTKGIAKAWCGANLKALLGLLGGLAAVVGTFSLIDFAKFLQPLIADGAKTALHFWRADIEGGIDQAFGDGGGAAVRDPSFGSA